MRICEVSAAGYRSLRNIRFPIGGLTVFVGANGVGKSNLYRALQLLQASAAGTLAAATSSRTTMTEPAEVRLGLCIGNNIDSVPDPPVIE